MKCSNCGHEVTSNDMFCNVCGNDVQTPPPTSFCGNCGAPMDAGAKFCGACGASPNTVPYYNAPTTPVTPASAPPKKSSSGLIILILILIIALTGAAFAGYVLYTEGFFSSSQQTEEPEKTERPKKTHAPEETKEPAKTEQPEETEAPSNTVYVDSEGFAHYYSNSYDFECKYPSWFTVVSDYEDYFSCESPDYDASMQIECEYGYNVTVSEAYNDYINSMNGSIDYHSVGSDYYAVRILYDSKYYYKYAELHDGYIYSFSVDFPTYVFTAYDNMINEIYKDFSKQF